MHEVIFIGPYNTSGKGGVNSVLQVYKSEFNGFRCVSTFPFQNAILNYVSFPFLLFWISGFVVVSRRSIVHIHGASKGSFVRKYLIYKFIRLLTKKSIIYHIHGANFDTYYKNANVFLRNRIRRMLHNVDAVVCLSESWKVFFQKEVGVKNVTVINNIISEPCQPLVLPLKTDSIVNFLFLGRIGQRKGIFDLLDVVYAHRLYLKGKFRLFVGGDGETNALKDYIHSNSLKELVEFVGWIDGPQKHALLSSCDVFILPSYSEGLPISILEAMSYGLPVISTTVGGIPELVQGNGFLCEPGDKCQLFLSIRKMIEINRSDFSRISKQLIHSYYPGAVFTQLKSLYNTLR